MQNSIEQIWQSGFADKKTLNVPDPDFYERKSTLVVERIRATYKNDNVLLPFIALVAGGILLLIGYQVIAIYVALLLVGMFLMNKSLLQQLEKLKCSGLVLEYLKNYLQTMKSINRITSWLMVTIGPMLMAPLIYVVMDVANHELIQQLIAEFWTDMRGAILLVFVVLTTSVIGFAAYRASTEVMYRKHLLAIEGMIEDLEMEE